jgi:GT2 family glycosyltransferase
VTQNAASAPLRTLDAPFARRPVCEDVSIVIPTLGRPILETCLASIAAGACWPGAVIVVDQGREPRVERMLARLGQLGVRTRYLPSTRRGRSAGLNRGLEAVDTRFVAITDDDCFVREDWLERLAARLREEPGTIWTGRVEAVGDEAAFSVVLARQPRRHTRPRLRVHPFVGGNCGLAMDVVRRVGPFDEHPCLASAEDSDYGHRALRLGVPIAYDPDVVLDHYHWRDATARSARYADYARSQGGFYGTHLRRGDALILLQALRALVRGPVRWLRGVLRGDREMAENGRASTRNLLPGIWAGLRRGAA